MMHLSMCVMSLLLIFSVILGFRDGCVCCSPTPKLVARISDSVANTEVNKHFNWHLNLLAPLSKLIFTIPAKLVNYLMCEYEFSGWYENCGTNSNSSNWFFWMGQHRWVESRPAAKLEKWYSLVSLRPIQRKMGSNLQNQHRQGNYKYDIDNQMML